MSDIHKNFFGQMPSQKKVIEGKLYRRLEIGEIIEEDDRWEIKNPLSYTDTEWFMMLVEMDFVESLMVGERYNPIRDHKHLIIWRLV